MKRLTQVLGASILAIAATGASQAQQATDWSTKLAKHDGVALRMSTITDPFIDAIKATKDGFTTLTGATVQVDGFGYDALHDQQLLGCTQKDSSTDILVIDGIWLGEFVEAGCLAPVEDKLATDPELIAWDDYTPSGQRQASWEGKRYCLPVGIYYGLLFYRTDLFEKAGKTPPKTFDELKELAKFFTNNPDYPGVSGYAMNNQRGAAAGQQYFEWIFNAGGKPWASNDVGAEDPYADLTPLLNSKESVELVQFFRDMVAFGPKGVESYAWDERASAFANGSLAMINDWSVRAQIVNDPKTSQIAGKFASTLMPSKVAGQEIPPVGGWIMCMNANGTQADAAWDFMKWFSSPEVHKAYSMVGGAPSRISSLNDPEVQAKYPWTASLAEAQGKSWAEGRPRHASTFQEIDTVGIEVNKAIIGEQTPQAAMDEANAKVTELLKRAGLLQ